jgi:putative NADPH-quinone reductase
MPVKSAYLSFAKIFCNYSAHRPEILKKVLDRVFGENFSFPPQLAPACFLHPKEPLRSHGAN